jgi:hypothetical protein
MAKRFVAHHGSSLGLRSPRIVEVTDLDDPDHKIWEDGSPHAALAGPTFEAWLDSLDLHDANTALHRARARRDPALAPTFAMSRCLHQSQCTRPTDGEATWERS